MKRDNKVKLIVGISLIFFIFLALKYRSDYLILYLSIVASIIQILLFFFWYLEDSTIINKVDLNVEKIRDIVEKKEEKNIYKNKIIKKLVNKGKVDEEEIRKILAKLESKDMIIISLSESKIPKGLQIGEIGQYPLRKVLSDIGFVPIFFTYYDNANIWVISKIDLPRSLRKIGILKNFLLSELKKVWAEIRKFANENYPSKFDKWKSGEGFRTSLIVGKSFENDFKIDYLGRPTFNEDFIAKILEKSSKEEINKAISDKVEVKEILSKLSVDMLLDKVNPNTKEVILNNEKKIKVNLGVKSFLDYRNIEENNLIDELKKYISLEESQKISKIILDEANNYYNEIEEMGLLIG